MDKEKLKKATSISGYIELTKTRIDLLSQTSLLDHEELKALEKELEEL